MTERPPLDGHAVAVKVERLVMKALQALHDVRQLEPDASQYLGPVAQTHLRLVASGTLEMFKSEIEAWEALK